MPGQILIPTVFRDENVYTVIKKS